MNKPSGYIIYKGEYGTNAKFMDYNEYEQEVTWVDDSNDAFIFVMKPSNHYIKTLKQYDTEEDAEYKFRRVIRVDVDDNSIIKNYKGGITRDDEESVKNALKFISSTFLFSRSGFLENGESYGYIDILDSKQECLKALETLYRCIDAFAIEDRSIKGA